MFSFFPPLNSDLALTCSSTYTINGSNHPPPRHQFLSSHCSHFPERFQGIIALTNHLLGSGAHEIDVPSFQNNGGALWGASWCHNFSSWQAVQVYFGPRMGTGPMKTQSGQLNQSPYRRRWHDCGVSSHQICSITFSVLSKLTAFTWKTRPPYLPRIEYCFICGNLCNFQSNKAVGQEKNNILPRTKVKYMNSIWVLQLDTIQ